MKTKLNSVRTFLFESKTIGVLIIKSLFILILPYIYLLLCGIIFDTLLKWYFMTTFIFFSMITLWILAIALVASMIEKFIKRDKSKTKKHTEITNIDKIEDDKRE